ncbi:MAG TPA: hypothetical protein VLT58_13175 [Polyangia bacterium]|nr:hypothetical protein [Polyangia bacterium]
MALVEVNGAGVIDGRLFFSRSGAWHAELRVDSLTEIAGAVTISIADGRLVLNGTAWRGAEYVDTAFVRVVAGADGLRKLALARGYNQTSVRVVLGHLLGDAGERLSPTADAATLARPLTSWTTAALPTGVVITRLLQSAAPGASWRALADGTIWVGPETWPDSGLSTDDYQILDEDPRQLVAHLGVEAPLLLPGTTLAGRRVSRVEHTLDAEGVRTWAWFEDAQTGTAPTLDRLKDAFFGAARAAAGPDHRAAYFARVIAQRGGTIDVEIENPTIAKFLPSLSNVPLAMPAAGAEVQMVAAGRVLIAWSGGDPARPYAFAPSADTVMDHATFNVNTALNLGDDAAQPFPNAAYRTADVTKNQTLAAAFTALASASTGPLAALAAQFTAAAAALTTFETGAPTYLTTKAKAT